MHWQGDVFGVRVWIKQLHVVLQQRVFQKQCFVLSMPDNASWCGVINMGQTRQWFAERPQYHPFIRRRTWQHAHIHTP